MQFAANDVICNLYTYVQSNGDCFETDQQRCHFSENIDNLKRHFVNHQSRWDNEAIKRDREGYIISSALAAQNFYAWIDAMRKDVIADQPNVSTWSKIYAKVTGQ